MGLYRGASRTDQLSAIALARRLLAEGVTRREVARQSGLSRGTVARIATGETLRTEIVATRVTTGRQPAPKLAYRSLRRLPGGYVRCPVCGGKVLWPCRLCAVRDDAA